MRKVALLLCALAAVLACTSKKEISWKDKTLPPEVRAQDLLSQLTLEEKASLTMHRATAVVLYLTAVR